MDNALHNASQVCWFVGASFGGNQDQTQRFLEQGIWEVRTPNSKEIAWVKSMQPGERIAIKAAYVRKRNLPFDNKGHPVSVMGIKAIGTIRENPLDGERVLVDWQPLETTREWYFYTYRPTIWRITPDDWMAQALIDFAFEGQPQDYARFCNAPYWQERFGTAKQSHRFEWTTFYEAIAEKLLDHQHDRIQLIQGIHAIAQRLPNLAYLHDRFEDDSPRPLEDICPFTVMGTFNRSITDTNRKLIAAELAALLDVDIPVPQSFEGIPILNNQRSWFFSFAKEREADDIDCLWRVFAAANRFVTEEGQEVKTEFMQAYDTALQVRGVAWNLSTGLYWAHPWDFPTLDSQSRHYINKKLNLTLSTGPQQSPCSAANYLDLTDNLKVNFIEESYPVHSFPELSLAAWLYKDPAADNSAWDASLVEEEQSLAVIATPSAMVPYTVQDIVKEGCFLEQAEIERMLERLRLKKNLILQGPPGTGKTWLAKRLAFALAGEKDESKMRAVQFHPNLSYEDFVRGWRPSGDGKLSIVNGVFMESVKAACAQPTSKFVVVIEEINRGNPAQVFGELLTLLEDSKRTPSEAIELCYPDEDGERRPVHIPENLFVIGTMNIADRSLALVDLALRRRFAFANLEPRLGNTWRQWVVAERNVDTGLAADIETRITELNQTIEKDPRLGPQFRIGHSYVTPSKALEAGATREWFCQVVETEIGPLLEEYWFDAAEDANKATDRLLQGW